MTRNALIKKYLDLKVEARMTDAVYSTSFADEFRSIYRNGTPAVKEMSLQELQAEVEALEASEGKTD